MIRGQRGYHCVINVLCQTQLKGEWASLCQSILKQMTYGANYHTSRSIVGLTPKTTRNHWLKIVTVAAAGGQLRGATGGLSGGVRRPGETGSLPLTSGPWDFAGRRAVHSSAADVEAGSIHVSGDGRSLQVHWPGQESRYHGTWLRHNCHCSQCKQEHSGQRLFKPHELHPSYTITKANVQDHEVVIEWREEPSHVTRIPLRFLQMSDYSPEVRKRQSAARQPVFLNESNFPEITYTEVSTSPAGLCRWLQALNMYGICMVRDVPTEPGMVRKVAEEIWPIQPTIYGEVFQVKSTPNPINVAYSDVPLGSHMDLMYYESPPGLQFLHCLRFDSCVEGGMNTFVDSFHTAAELREKYPEDFTTLTRVPATFQKIHYDRDRPVHMCYQRPHITLGPEGLITSVNWSPPFEGPLSVKEEDVEPYYQAYHRFAMLLESSESKVERRLNPGDLISFNNRRILHARKGFELNGGMRFLEGCYVNIDEFKSQVQVLSNTAGDGSDARHVGNHCWF